MLNFDAILEATERAIKGGPVVLSEQHDVSRISTEGMASGFVDPAAAAQGQVDDFKRRIADLESGRGFFDEAEYGISRAQQVAQFKKSLAQAEAALERSNSPEGRAEALKLLAAAEAELVERAVRRAGLDTSNGRVNVVVAGAPAWHRLGVNVAGAMTSAQAIALAGLDWEADKVLAQHNFNGEWVEAKGVYLLRRKDTGAVLGVVGNRYKPIQNAQGFAFLDKVMAEHGAKYHTAGSVHGGAKVWMQVELPKQSFEVVAGDEVQAYATFFNPHDGSGKAFVYPTTQRVVCNNTLRIANHSQSKGIGLRHTGNIEAAIGDAQEALGLAVRGFERFKDQAAVLARTPVVGTEYFGRVLDQVLDVTEAQMKLGAGVLAQQDLLNGVITTTEARQKAELEYQRAIDTRKSVLDDIIDRYESEKNGVGGIRGTAWAALNAVTESADHGRLGTPGRKVGSEHERASRRFESILAGDADAAKQVALQTALALALAIEAKPRVATPSPA